MASHTPLFSRRQLNIIIVITAMIIALLSIPSEPWPQIQRLSLQQVPLSYIVDDDRPFELRLSFALPKTALLPVEPALALRQLLDHRAGATFSTRLSSDRLTISISAPSSTALAQHLQQLPRLLLEPFERTAIASSVKQHLAQRHINRQQRSAVQQADAWLRHHQPPPLSATSGPITEDVINLLQQQLFSRSQLRLSLIGPQPETITAELSAMLEQFDIGKSWGQDATSPTADQARVTEQLAPVAALQPLAGRQSAGFAEALLLSRMLAQLAPEATLQLHPGAKVSWLIWIEPNRTDTSPTWLATQLKLIRHRLNTMKDWELERAADDLRQQLEHRLLQPQAIADQLEVIAFYQLPVDYLPQFDATIAALTRAEIRQQLLALLQPERFSYPISNPTQQP
ncbi:MAG: hypothetical protein V7752_21380 [Halopseudomonas sp.]